MARVLFCCPPRSKDRPHPRRLIRSVGPAAQLPVPRMDAVLVRAAL
ncbi:hypothetical protein [Craurococcus roseus]